MVEAAEELLGRVGERWSAGDFPGALELLEGGASDYPLEVELWINLLRIGLNMEPADWPDGPVAFYERFLAHARQAIQKHGEDFMHGDEIHSTHGTYLRRRALSQEPLDEGGMRQAIEAFSQGLEQHESSAALYYNRACALALLGEADAATSSLREAIRFDEDHWENAKTDSDFDGIRDHPGLDQLLERKPVIDKLVSDEEMADIEESARVRVDSMATVPEQQTLAARLPLEQLERLRERQNWIHGRLEQVAIVAGVLSAERLHEPGDCTGDEMALVSTTTSALLFAEYGEAESLLLSLSAAEAGIILGHQRGTEPLDYLEWCDDAAWSEIKRFFLPVLALVQRAFAASESPKTARLLRDFARLQIAGGAAYFQFHHELALQNKKGSLNVYYSHNLLARWLAE